MTAVHESDDDTWDDAPAPADGVYQSPVLLRMASGGARLTADFLSVEVPVYQAGNAARQTLATADVTDDERPRLVQAVHDGDRAKERLMFAGIPLIKHLAQKEHQRRSRWQTQVSLDDLFQEGIIGLMLGLNKYDIEQRSPSNYLGMWINTTMRRNVESAEHHFSVPTEAAERARRIRAIRSRLASELGREPSDDEIIAAWSDPTYLGRGMMGRKENAGKPAKKTITHAHLDEERAMRSRIGPSLSLQRQTDADAPDLVDAAAPIFTQDWDDTMSTSVDESSARDGLARLLRDTMNLLGMPQTQREVIARKFGLPPHLVEQSAREIAKDMQIQRSRVSHIVDAFTEQMTRKGGAFHRACDDLGEGELHDLNLGWVGTTLGRFADIEPAERRIEPPPVLVEVIAVQETLPPPPPENGPGKPGVVLAQFVCPYHQSGFTSQYLNVGSVPKSRACPQCGSPSRLIRRREP